MVATLVGAVGPASADTWYSVNDPIDPAYLTELPEGDASQWIQPWRAYLDTPPATALLDGMGVNFNVPADQASVTAQLLAASGIKRARVEISWTGVSYSNPSQFWDASDLETIIGALRDNGIRPLILLNANQELPGPAQTFNAMLTADAAAGATTVNLDPATAAQVVPGHTGLNIGSEAAGVMFTSVDANDVATLSRPLPSAFPAGAYPATTLLYQPFAQPLLADGSPNPQFETTLNGWLSYVGLVMNLVTQTYGSDDFDVEVWNEVDGDSDFLDIGNYYNPLPQATEGNTDAAILTATTDFLHDPANGWPDVKVGDGFTNQTAPTDDVSQLPVGVNAIDKHPYVQLVQFPSGSAPGPSSLDAQGNGEGTVVDGQSIGRFAPTYNAFFPEFYLTGIHTETLIRELAPITTFAGGLQLGRATAPLGGSPPAMWVTEDNMAPNYLELIPPFTLLTPQDYDHVHAKAALRTYVSFIGKGVQAVDLYAVDGYPTWNLVDPAFFSAAQVGSSDSYVYPGTALGGPVMDATRRLAATLAGAQTITTPRPLSLLGIANDSENYQFLGNGTPQFPTLYDRDALMFQPFQLTDHSWVAAVYVMTRNIGVDLAPENFRITVGGLNAVNLTASATDPLTGDSVPVTIIARDGTDATLQMPVTDSPEMVTLDDSAAPAAPFESDQPSPSPGSVDVSAPQPAAQIPVIPTRARSSEPVLARARIRRTGVAVYLQLKCNASCRVRWSVAAPASSKRRGRWLRLAADRLVRIRVATLKPRLRAAVALTIVDLRTGRTSRRRLVVAAAHSYRGVRASSNACSERRTRCSSKRVPSLPSPRI